MLVAALLTLSVDGCSCSGPYKGLTIQIVKGTGAGQSGIIQGGPDRYLWV